MTGLDPLGGAPDAAPRRVRWAKSRSVGGVSEIAVMAPVKKGCPAGERRTHEERLRANIGDLAKRHELGLRTELDRVSSIHFGRMIVIRPEQYLVCSNLDEVRYYQDRIPRSRAPGGGGQIPMPFDDYSEGARPPPRPPELRSWLLTLVEFDGDLRLYMRDIARFLREDFDNIFQDCEDYPGTSRFDDFWQWIRCYQINTDLFYATYPGLSVARIKELELFKRRFDDFVARVRPAHNAPEPIDKLFDEFLNESLQHACDFPKPNGSFGPDPGEEP